jgi:hypothetical protein
MKWAGIIVIYCLSALVQAMVGEHQKQPFIAPWIVDSAKLQETPTCHSQSMNSGCKSSSTNS